MSLHFFSDHCVPLEIVDILKRHGHQITLLKEALPIRSPDPVVLAKADLLSRETLHHRTASDSYP